MAERPVLHVIAEKDGGEDNALGINDTEAIVADLFDAPGRRKTGGFGRLTP
jgi:hypothetical protein